MAEIFDTTGRSLGDPNAPEKAGGRSDSDRARDLPKHEPVEGAAAYDPAARGTMGGQSGGGDYEHPAMGNAEPGHAEGGQSNPGYSGTGRLAGKKVSGGANENAVTHGDHDRKAP